MLRTPLCLRFFFLLDLLFFRSTYFFSLDLIVAGNTSIAQPGWNTPLTEHGQLIFEIACHEGDYSTAGVLAGARSEEKRRAGERCTVV